MKEICPAVKLPETYRLNEAFSDDFDGNVLNAEKWTPLCPWFEGRIGFFYFDPENVSVRDGLLRLTARMPEPGTAPLRHHLTGSDRYSTAFVQSRKRVRYGYFEARCRSMKAGVCNAFWLHDPLDPPAKWKSGDYSEEIDIFEVFGKHPDDVKNGKDRLYYTTLHKSLTPYVEGRVNGGHEHTSHVTRVPYEFWESFHVYSLLWTADRVTWYADGTEVFSAKNEYLHRALYLNFDCEIMFPWVGLPESGDLPAEYEIDYVRVWQAAE